jgi:hypothetical protein
VVKLVSEAPPKSAATFGALSIFVNLTRYQPILTEEQRKMRQLKAYANAAGKLSPQKDALEADEKVAERCKLVFNAGVVPVLVTQTAKTGSPASMGLAVAIVYSLSMTPALRGPLAQQGAVNLLITTWSALPSSDSPARRTAAQALARILISINPVLVLGGNRPTPLTSAIRPLASIIPPDPAGEVRDLLPTFEALMALTNLASVEDTATRRIIIDAAWPYAEEQLLSSNPRVTKAAVELVCNLVQAPEGMALYADGSAQAKARMHVLLALADAEDEGTRSAAGGALAGLTAHEAVVQAICERAGGVGVVLGLCRDKNEDLRHRGAVTVYNMVATAGKVGEATRENVRECDGIEALKDSARESRRPEVIECVLQALKVLLEN